jgi:hypothetical protein
MLRDTPNLEVVAIVVVRLFDCLVHKLKDFFNVTNNFSLPHEDNIQYIKRSKFQLLYILISLHTHQMVSNLEFLGKEFKYITPLHGFQSLKSSNLMMKGGS